MASITVRAIDQENEWEQFIASHPEANFLHSWYWGEFHARIGHEVIRLGFYEDNQLTGVVLAIVEPAKRGRHLIVPAGPIIDWNNQSLVKTCFEELAKAAKQHACVFIRVRPQLLDNDQNRQLFKTLGFKKAPMHLHAELTSQIDLTKSDGELKKAMRKGTRYEINSAAKLGIKVTTVSDEPHLDEFYQLQLETARRQKFVPFSRKFLIEQFKVFADASKVLLYRAEHNNKLLGYGFIIFYGQEAAYHYGASTDLARQLPGAYAIQWEAIAEARRRGCSRYNFWGVTEHGQTKHRFYGVSVFKRGFGGEDVAYLPAHDLVINSKRYVAIYMFETARRKIRKL